MRADSAGDEVTESAGAQVAWAVRSSRPGFYSVKQEAVWGEAAEPCDLLQVGHPGRWGRGSRELARRGRSSERTTIASWKEVRPPQGRGGPVENRPRGWSTPECHGQPGRTRGWSHPWAPREQAAPQHLPGCAGFIFQKLPRSFQLPCCPPSRGLGRGDSARLGQGGGRRARGASLCCPFPDCPAPHRRLSGWPQRPPWVDLEAPAPGTSLNQLDGVMRSGGRGWCPVIPAVSRSPAAS